MSRNSKVPCLGGQATLNVKGLFSRSMAVRDPTTGWSCTDVAITLLMMGGSGTRMIEISREAVAWVRRIRKGGELLASNITAMQGIYELQQRKGTDLSPVLVRDLEPHCSVGAAVDFHYWPIILEDKALHAGRQQQLVRPPTYALNVKKKTFI